METKICKKCGQILTIDNFPRKKYRSGNIGIAGICKGCENARRRAKRLAQVNKT